MLSFTPIGLSEAIRLRGLAEKIPFRLSEYAPTILYMWQGSLDSEVCFLDDMAFFRVNRHSSGCEYLLPIGAPLRKSLSILKERMCSDYTQITILAIPETALNEVKSVFGEVEFSSIRKWSDYLYNAEDIKSLTGRRYGGQRNHINRFMREYPNFCIEQITPDNIGAVREFLQEFINSDTREKPQLFETENRAAMRVLENFNQLCLLGAYISVDNNIVSFAVGEVVGSVLFVHIEKANTAYHGSYPMIVKAFANKFATADVRYINREDDADDEGLRTSKMSYHPIELLTKYYCTVKL